MLEVWSGIGTGMVTVVKICDEAGRVGANLQIAPVRKMQDTKLEHSGPFPHFC